MRLLILANMDSGLYKFRKELIRELISQGHSIFISLPDGDYIPLLEKEGCVFIKTPVDRRGINPITDYRLLQMYRGIIRRIEPDYVITYTIKPNVYGGIAARLARKKYSVNITGLGTAFEKAGVIRFIVRMLYRYALKNAKIVFFENSSNRDCLVSYGCCKKEQTVVLNGAGVNTKEFCYQPYPKNPIFRFLFVGRVMKEKGVDELFKAMKRMIQEGEQCVLDVVGSFEENYKATLDMYESEGWLFYHGFQNDVRPFIASCDCFVLPSYHEGMANTNLESASSGRPIITCDIPGCRESVINGKSGLLCEPKNVESLYQAMRKMILNNHRKEMGMAGREYMVSVFDKKRVVLETIDNLFS